MKRIALLGFLGLALILSAGFNDSGDTKKAGVQDSVIVTVQDEIAPIQLNVVVALVTPIFLEAPGLYTLPLIYFGKAADRPDTVLVERPYSAPTVDVWLPPDRC